MKMLGYFWITSSIPFYKKLRHCGHLLRAFAPLILLLAACAAPPPVPSATAVLQPSSTAVPTRVPTGTRAPASTSLPTATVAPLPTPVVFTGAGDISICGQTGDDQTAALLAALPGEFFTAGDNSNESGALFEFERCFAPSWGQFKDRIHPAAGNHEYNTPGAADYYQYFGAAAGNPGEGWYTFMYGGWQIVVLNSNCNDVACGSESAQVRWLREQLAASSARCTLAVWHHPRWSSGLAGSDGRMSPAYRALYEAGAEIVISGHDHHYERFMPLDPQGKPDPERGIRQFVVGTGGVNYRLFGTILPESEVRNTGAFGVLKLELAPDGYAWEFLPVAGETFTDSGSAVCH